MPMTECPRCQSPMVEGRAPFYLHDEYVGIFESLVCDMCHYSLLTSAGYDKAMIEARRFGLVGPEEDVINETVEMVDTSYAMEDLVIPTNNLYQHQEFRKSDEDLKSESITSVGRILIPVTQTRQQPTRRTEFLVHQS